MHALAVAAAAIVLVAGCAALRPRPDEPWLLLEPPGVEDAAAPDGIRLRPSAPLAEWHVAARFRQATACEVQRQQRARRAIAAARAARGDRAAFDPAVRRAVNARCVEDRPRKPWRAAP